jgi:hypothetical protein
MTPVPPNDASVPQPCPTCGDVTATACGSSCPLYQRPYQRTRYQRLRDAGRCVQCGQDSVTPPHARCDACLAYHRAYWASVRAAST